MKVSVARQVREVVAMAPATSWIGPVMLIDRSFMESTLLQ